MIPRRGREKGQRQSKERPGWVSCVIYRVRNGYFASSSSRSTHSTRLSGHTLSGKKAHEENFPEGPHKLIKYTISSKLRSPGDDLGTRSWRIKLASSMNRHPGPPTFPSNSKVGGCKFRDIIYRFYGPFRCLYAGSDILVAYDEDKACRKHDDSHNHHHYDVRFAWITVSTR